MRVYDEKDRADVKILNEFLTNEMAAVETYGQCIEKMSEFPVLQRLRDLQHSHAGRVNLLKERVETLGGEAANDSGVWGDFAKMMEGGARMFSEQSALSMLEAGEDKGLSDYRADIDKLSAENRTFIISSILPEQQRSHDHMRQLIK